MASEEETVCQWDSAPVKVKTKKRRKRAVEQQVEQVERGASEEDTECQQDSAPVKVKTKKKIKKEAVEQPIEQASEEETEWQRDCAPVKVKTKKRRKRAVEQQVEQVERVASEEDTECQQDSAPVKVKTKKKIKKEAVEQPIEQASEEETEWQRDCAPVKVKTENKIKREAVEQPIEQASEEETEWQRDCAPVKVKTKKIRKKAVEQQVGQIEIMASEEQTECSYKSASVKVKRKKKIKKGAVEQQVCIKEEVKDNNWCQIYVRNIPTAIQETHLRQLFSRYGEIQDLLLLLPENGDAASGIIVFKNPEDAVKALEVNGMEFMGHQLRVKRKIKHLQKRGQQTEGPRQIKQKPKVLNNYEQPTEEHSYSPCEKYSTHNQFRKRYQNYSQGPQNYHQPTQFRNRHQPPHFRNHYQPFNNYHRPTQFRNYQGHSGPQKQFTQPRQPAPPIPSSQTLKLEDVISPGLLVHKHKFGANTFTIAFNGNKL